jgi:hypothetical protein
MTRLGSGMLACALLLLGLPAFARAAQTPLYVISDAVSSGVSTVNATLPAGILSGDILLLFVETSNQTVTVSNQNGGTWTQVSGSPHGTGTGGNTTSTSLTVFWSRYNGTQGAPTLSDSGDHDLARMIAIRGAADSGDPTDVTAGSADATANTSVSIPGATTTGDNELVISAVATALPDGNGTANFSGESNSDLGGVAELTDNTVSSGAGGGLAIIYGTKDAAGAYGATSVTLANSSVKATMTIALKPGSTIPAPWVLGAGAVASNGSAISPALPNITDQTMLSGDMLILPLETSNQAISIANANGGTWTQFANSPQGTGTGGNTTSTSLTVFWSRYNGTQGAPTTSDSGDHQLGRMIAVRGLVGSGDPTDVTAGSADATANTSASIPGATTSVDNDAVLVLIATALPDATGSANFTETNGDLADFAEVIDNTVTAGAGGGLGAAGGLMAAAGAYGATSVTLANSSVKATMTIALKPPAAPVIDLTPSRVMRLFEGYTIRLVSGTMKLYPQ